MTNLAYSIISLLTSHFCNDTLLCWIDHALLELLK